MTGATKHAKGFVKRGGYVVAANVPFKEILPLKQRNQVSGKGRMTSAPACVQQMSLLFSCLKANNFQDSMCSQEVNKFTECYNNHMESRRRQKEQERQGVLHPGENKLSHKQANELLKRYPVRDY